MRAKVERAKKFLRGKPPEERREIISEVYGATRKATPELRRAAGLFAAVAQARSAAFGLDAADTEAVELAFEHARNEFVHAAREYGKAWETFGELADADGELKKEEGGGDKG